ncbi:GMC oxidoreductase [Xylariomycetidae sp. FL0641]|nr:GMC oxidoreductase [Xylariomycetidae sp. FL0641]
MTHRTSLCRVAALLAGSVLAAGSSTASNSTTYDYVVVGGGTAGLVIAGRLANNTDYSVLVVEAGPSVRDDARVTDPNGMPSGTDLDWLYRTAEQEYTGTPGQVQYISSGKALGGTSAINGMAYTRSSAAQIDAWEALGNAGWNWDALYAASKRGEALHPPDATQAAVGRVAYDAGAHGTSGPLALGWRRASNREGVLYPLLRDAFAELGVAAAAAAGDVNGGRPFGLANPPFEVDVAANVREDAARAYYWPVAARRPRQLRVLLNTTAERITWAASSGDDAPATASGVVVTRADGSAQAIRARREVIVRRGSGVGGAARLAALGIAPAVADLPGVGENLQEQTSANLAYNLTAGANVTDSGYFFAWATASQLGLAALGREVGANLSAYAAAQAAAYNHSVGAAALETLFRTQHGLVFGDRVPAAVLGSGTAGDAGDALATRAWALAPFSRGSVHLASRDASDVVINPRYFLLEADVRMFAAAAAKARELYGAEALAGVVGAETSPGLAAVPSREDWVEYLSSNFNSNCHFVGTCSMLPKSLGGVVDPSAKVYGTTNLRVVDASIVPFQPSGPPSATVYGVAERVAEIMLAEL